MIYEILGTKIDGNHPAYKVVAALIERDVGDLSQDDIRKTIDYLDKCNPESESYNKAVAGSFAIILQTPLDARRVKGSNEKNQTFSSEINPDLLEELYKKLEEVVGVRNQVIEKQRKYRMVPNTDLRDFLAQALEGFQEIENDNIKKVSPERESRESRESRRVTESNRQFAQVAGKLRDVVEKNQERVEPHLQKWRSRIRQGKFALYQTASLAGSVLRGIQVGVEAARKEVARELKKRLEDLAESGKPNNRPPITKEGKTAQEKVM